MDVYQQAEKFQRELLKREQAAAREMVRVYREAWLRIQEDLARLEAEYAAAKLAGLDPGWTWIYEFNRANTFRVQVEAELTRFSAFAENSINTEKRELLSIAGEQAKALVERAAGTTVFWDGIDTNALEALVGLTQTDSPVHSLLLSISAEGAEAAEAALVQNMLQGNNPRLVAQELRKVLGTVLSRALTIARTETLRAHRVATRANYQANKDLVSGWIWHSSADRRTCACCWAMHGTQHGLDETLDGHPNCRCAMVPILYSISFEVTLGSQLFDKLKPVEQIGILGPSKFAAWKDGKVTLDEIPATGIVGRNYSSVWGSTRTERSLISIVGPEAAREYYKKR